VLAHQVVGAAELEDAQPALVEAPECLVGQVEDPVCDRELRRIGDLLGRVLTDEQQNGVRVGDLAREIVGDVSSLPETSPLQPPRVSTT
jgi:hypothetical protein